MNDLNTLPNQWTEKEIGKWLLNGMQCWDEVDEPWLNAFKPLSLYHDQDLERQLIAHFAKTDSHAIQNFTIGVVNALEHWNRTLYSYAALEGLLHIVVEISALETLPLIRKLILEDLQGASEECQSTLLVAINSLACLSPKREAITLLKEIQSRDKPIWHSKFAPLTFIAYIVADPNDWPKYLADLRSDFMQLEGNPDTDLDPEIFFVEVVDIIGVHIIAKNLHKLDINSNPAPDELMDADKWFIDKMIGLSNSRLIVLRGHEENQWNLMYRKHYPCGQRYTVALPNNDEFNSISSRLNNIFQGYTYFADKQCEFLAEELINAIKSKAILEVAKVREYIVELYDTYEKTALHYIHYFSSSLSEAIVKQPAITSMLKEISGIQSYSFTLFDLFILKTIEIFSSQQISISPVDMEDLVQDSREWLKSAGIINNKIEPTANAINNLNEKGVVIGGDQLMLSSFSLAEKEESFSMPEIPKKMIPIINQFIPEYKENSDLRQSAHLAMLP